MNNDNILPKFIQQTYFPIKSSQATTNEKDEKLILNLLNKGIGLWKGENQLFIEYAKNLENIDLSWIEKNAPAIYASLEVDKKYFPLSFSQQMMCVQSELYKNTSYQLPIPFFITLELIEEKLDKAFIKMVKRHETLRTIFPKLQHQWIQLILPDVKSNIIFLDFSAFDEKEQKTKLTNLIHKENQVRFNLSEAPLFKLTSVKLSKKKYFMVLTVHHAIFDGLSFPIFANELMQYYHDQSLSPLTAHYGQFVLEQKSIPELTLEKEIAWWKNELQHAKMQTHFPSDLATENKSQSIEIVSHSFSESIREKLFEFCKLNKVSITLLIFSAIYLLLHKITKQNDIVIGTILNQRNRVNYENLIGDFNNLVPLHMQLNTAYTHLEFIKEVQNVFFNAFNHQKITFNELMTKLKLKRNQNQLPYNVFLDSLNFDAFQRSFDQNKIEIISQSDFQLQAMPLMDLFFLLVQQSRQLTLHCSYNAALFQTTAIESMLNELEKILLECIKHPEKPIKLFKQKKSQHARTLICIPGAEGQTDIFTRLTNDLKIDSRYAIKYQGMDIRSSPPFTTITEIADNFISNIKKLNLTPPVALIGLSTGGIVAFEILQKLKSDELISDLILLDSPAPNTENETSFSTYGIENALNLVINYANKYFAKKNSSELKEEMKSDEVYKWIKSNTSMPLPSYPQFNRWVEVINANMTAVSTYQATPYHGAIRVNYISATKSSGLSKPTDNKNEIWKALFPNAQINFHFVPDSDHFSLFFGENIHIIQRLLKKILHL